jgi:nucleoside-diphosphate-sugar epimerase
LNILEVSRIFKIKKVVFTSSGAVYGNAEAPSEENTGIEPTTLYGATKAAGELLGLQYAHHWGIDFRCARLYYLYGPPARPSSYPAVIKVLFGPLEGLDHMKLEVGGDQRADFTYVKDAARGVLLLYEAGKLKHRVFNITGGKAYKFSEVLDTVKKHSKVRNVEIGPGYTEYPRSFQIDISRAKKEIQFMLSTP